MYKGKKTFKGKPRRKDYLDDTTYSYDGKPPVEDKPETLISVKAMKNLPHSSYSMLADPYLAALPASSPYPILNVFNRTVGGSYAGDRNIDGGNVQQYANSLKSKFLQYFDVIRTQIGINYRYLPILTSAGKKGSALVNEMRRSIAESVSVLQSTTYTQMAINNFAVVTDLPMGDAKTTVVSKGESETIDAYTDRTDVLYAMSIYYQIVLQNLLNTFNFHNAFRLKQGTAIRNAWNREVPILNALFGLFNKKAFISQWESISLLFEGEYVDLDFARQASMLNVMPSRRSNSITDPVLELQTHFNHPGTFKVYILDAAGKAIGDPIFDDANFRFISKVSGDKDNPTIEYTTFWEACENLNDYLSLEATEKWARNATVAVTLSGSSDAARFNFVNLNVRGILACMNMFKPAWADYREALDTISRTGALKWTKGFRPKVTADNDAALFRNLVVDDIYSLIFSGAASIEVDDNTKRWRTFSMWNMYTGIPEYDAKQGGAFLTYSFKDVTGDDSDSLQEYMPVIFNSVNQTGGKLGIVCACCSRDGKEALITPRNVKMSGVWQLERLAPLESQKELVIRVPTLTNDNISKGGLTRSHLSCLQKQLTGIFGLSAIQTTQNEDYDYCVDPDILSIYQIEITDTTNEAITYARANAPLKGTDSPDGILGFFGSMTGSSKVD